MNNQTPPFTSSKNRGTSPRHQDFLTYKDFTSDKSLESEDFNESFGAVNNSFYSSGNEEQGDSILMNLQQKDLMSKVKKLNNKEEETNYTSKPALIIDKEEVKKSVWCGNCVFNSGQEGNCSLF
jgi:hypothetical protein